ncbi:MAG: response regulator [Thermoguttaceae bacterium]
MSSPLRIVYLEDDPADVRLVRDTLSDDGLSVELTAVDNRADFLGALARNPDLILADYALPTFDGLEALVLCRARCPERPFIFVTGAMGEERAIQSMKSGATDYVLKDHLSGLTVAVRRALAEAEEITERKRAEEERTRAAEETQRQKDLLAVTLASIGDGVIVTNAQGRVTFLNGEAERLTGWSKQEAAGQPLPAVFRIVNADTRGPVENPVDKVLRLGTIVGLANHTVLIARDGRETPIDDSGAPIRQSDGTMWGVVLVFRDFTKQKQAEEALQRAKAQAEAASEAKSRFVANISHELRTPMNAILGMVDLALRKTTETSVRDFLSTARDSAGLLLALLNDLLDSAKMESGKLELELAPFSLRRVLAQTTEVLAVRASERGISFSCRVSPDVPDALIGDHVRLRQVLLNLAGNGIKFTDKGEVTISVQVAPLLPGDGQWLGTADERTDHAMATSPHPNALRTPSEGRSGEEDVALEFAVRDTGIGIPKSDLDRIFQPFAQADASTTRRFGGTGLGLTICSSLVRLMDGRIWVESEPGQGSTFYFTVRLPLAEELPPEAEPPRVLPAPSRKLGILLVEDNPANQKLATYILHARGHTIDVAGNGFEGIHHAVRKDYDVILMDVQMPGMDGLDATKAIRAREMTTGGDSRRVPIIAMTAHAMKGDRDRCLAAGVDGYLSKPIDGHEMIALVENLAASSASSAASRVSSPLSPPQPTEPAAPVFSPELAMTRSKAEERLRMGNVRPALTVSAADALALVHELQVHQIELEMQKEELQRAQAAFEEASRRYSDLFDSAPIAYFLWDQHGRILEVNLAGAALLGLNRDEVIHKRFGQFMCAEDRDRFAHFCVRVLATDSKQTCRVKVLNEGHAADVLVEGIATPDRHGQERLCRAAVIGTSQPKSAGELAAADRVFHAVRLPATATAPAAVVFDPELAFSRCSDSQDLVREMIQYFFDDVDKLFPQMRAALETKDLVEVGRLGHRMKGTVVYLGAKRAEEAALRVERCGRSSDGIPSAAEEAVNSLERECMALKSVLIEHPPVADPVQRE